MADEAAPAAPVTPAAPAAVDPRAAALKHFAPEATPDTKAPAPSASSDSTPAEGNPETAPATAAPAAAEEEKGTPPAEQEPKLREGYARLARDKAKLLSERKAIDARAAELKAWDDIRAKVKASPAAVLAAHGLTLEQVAEDYLRQEAGATAPTVEDKLATLQAKQDARDAAEKAATEQTAAQQRQSAIEAGVNVVKETVASEAAKYPTIMALGEHKQVFDALGQYAQRHGLGPDDITTDLVKVVAVEVEKQLAEDLSGLVEKVPHIARRAQAPQTPATGQPTSPGAKGTSAVTLASAAVSEAPPPQPRKGYTVEELRKLALAKFTDTPAA